MEALWPYQVATILNYTVQNDSANVPSDLKTLKSWNTLNKEGSDFVDFFGPINQLILENQHCINFTGFSLSDYSSAIARHRWLRKGLCDKAYDSGMFFDGPSTAMFLWRGDWPLGPPCHDNIDAASQALLPKRIVSQNSRFIFFAGIEGTGHHYWHDLLTHLHPFTNWSSNLSAELYNSGHRVGFFSTYNETLRSIHATQVMQLMRDADQNVREQGGGIVPLNVLCERISGMMSYPNLLGIDRALQNPDVRALANLAERAGVDLRIVLLVRHPASVVHSGLKRGFEKKGLMHAIKTYTSTLSLLNAQLSLLDPSFIACWRYEAPTAGISDLVSFMGAQEEKPGDFSQVVAKQYKHGSNEMVSSAEAKQALQTATALHSEILGKYCKTSLADAYDASQALLPKRIVSQN